MRPSRGAALSVLAVSRLLHGQLVTDEVPRERTASRKEEIRQDLEESRFRLGPVRLSPRLAIQNLGYNDNVFGAAASDPNGTFSDYTATVAAGVRATVPLSSKLTLRAEFLPSYIWYAHEVQRRGFGGNLGASLIGLFNRLTFEATGYASRADTVVTSEVPALQRETLKAGRLGLEIAFLRRLSFISSGEYQQRRYSLTGAEPPSPIDVERNDRKEWAARAGLRYRFSDSVDVSAGVEGTWTSFYIEEQGRDNASRAVIVGLHIERPRLLVNLSGAYRRGEEWHESGFPTYREPTGSGFVSFTLWRPLDLELTGHCRITYSLSADSPYYIESRYGAGLKIRLGARLTLAPYGELGKNDYPAVSSTGAAPQRKDDATVYGGTATVVLASSVSASASYRRSRYDSNIDAYDRRYNEFWVGLSLGGDLLR